MIRAEWSAELIEDRTDAKRRDTEEYVTGPRYRLRRESPQGGDGGIDVVVELRMPRAYVAKAMRDLDLTGTGTRPILDLLYGEAGDVVVRRLADRADRNELERPDGDVLDLWLDGSDVAFLAKWLRDRDAGD